MPFAGLDLTVTELCVSNNQMYRGGLGQPRLALPVRRHNCQPRGRRAKPGVHKIHHYLNGRCSPLPFLVVAIRGKENGVGPWEWETFIGASCRVHDCPHVRNEEFVEVTVDICGDHAWTEFSTSSIESHIKGVLCQ